MKQSTQENYAIAGLFLFWQFSCAIVRPYPERGMELGEEAAPAGEAPAVVRLNAQQAEAMGKRYATARPARRDTHAKGQGCAKALFTVGVVPDAYRVGLFSEPKTYRAWVRFSNAAETRKADDEPDGRGMAIKLMGVGGDRNLEQHRGKGTYDLLMINDKAHIVRDVERYVEFTRHLHDGKPARYFLKSAFGGRGPSGHREVRNARHLARQKPESMLTQRYWSMVPYAFGDGAAKFTAFPCGVTRKSKRPCEVGFDYYRQDLVSRLKEGSYCFAFGVQRQTDPVKTPIEDPTVIWSERRAEIVPVARLEILRQEFDSPGQHAFCENLSMNPWNSMPELRPLGGINRVRKVVYEAISDLRHRLNEVEPWEPVDWSIAPR